MRAIIQSGYGDPAKVLAFGDVERPEPGDGQLLVRVRASSVNAGDWRRVKADPLFLRLMSGFRRPKAPGLGGDVAGVVEARGPGDVDLPVGAEVFGICSGAYAEYVAGQSFVAKPHNLTLAEAATIPIAGVTALQALQKHGEVQPGERVLINGAGGGVGVFAVQIAKALGAHVTAVTATDKVQMIRSLGADDVADYTRHDFTKDKATYDLIVDIGGNRSVRSMRRVLSPQTGRLVMVGAGRGPMGVLTRIIGGVIRSRVLKQRLKFFVANGPYKEQLTTLREMVEAGQIRPVIERSYPWTDAAVAISRGATEQTAGKIGLTID